MIQLRQGYDTTESPTPRSFAVARSGTPLATPVGRLLHSTRAAWRVVDQRESATWREQNRLGRPLTLRSSGRNRCRCVILRTETMNSVIYSRILSSSGSEAWRRTLVHRFFKAAHGAFIAHRRYIKCTIFYWRNFVIAEDV